MIQKIEMNENIASYIKGNFGEEYFRNYYNYYKSASGKTTVRLSSLQHDHTRIIEDLKHYGIILTKIAAVPDAYIVEEGEDKIGKTLQYSFGEYYIQSQSSMMPPLVLNPQPGERVLDLCAAPGSKSTQLAEKMQNRGTLVLNEPSNGRIKSLVFNVDKMNFTNAGIILGKGELLSPYFDEWFDKVLVDAPCSALGIMHKKGEVNNWWTERHASSLSDLQLRLLIAGIKMLKVGGELVYSTCTLTVEENEMVLNKVLQKYLVETIEIELPVKSEKPFSSYGDTVFEPGVASAHRIIPWETGSEGFFVVKLRKTGSTEKAKQVKDKREDVRFIYGEERKISGYLDEISGWYGIERNILNGFKYILRNKDLYFVNSDWDYSGKDIFLRIGSKFGSVDKKGFVRLHTLAAQALGPAISKNIIDIDNDEYLNTYLNGGIIRNDFGASGQKVVSFASRVIGTAVNTGEGLKSQYPRAFRTHEIITE